MICITRAIVSATRDQRLRQAPAAVSGCRARCTCHAVPRAAGVPHVPGGPSRPTKSDGVRAAARLSRTRRRRHTPCGRWAKVVKGRLSARCPATESTPAAAAAAPHGVPNPSAATVMRTGQLLVTSTAEGRVRLPRPGTSTAGCCVAPQRGGGGEHNPNNAGSRPPPPSPSASPSSSQRRGAGACCASAHCAPATASHVDGVRCSPVPAQSPASGGGGAGAAPLAVHSPQPCWAGHGGGVPGWVGVCSGGNGLGCAKLMLE